ncbi:M4 family metallopeptidase [Alteribacter natronophilus]|uniref:M4 family metallopeptidase n=1 Tax=Alteribacter natronophilus TaxID=2583810 RepID=UPI00110ED733|nr:M4 family metallopeptidase [Alteribacter natronophilus]TMW71434.1 peptidase M4 family protein [Alteribacter natronophilus]
MKKTVSLVLSGLILGSGFLAGGGSGQADDQFGALGKDKELKVLNQNGQGPPSFVAGMLSERFEEANGQNAKRFLEKHSDTFEMDAPLQSLEEVRSTTDDLGMTHVRLQQKVNGVPVDRNELNVHFNENNEVTVVNGNYDSQIDSIELNTTPELAENTAVSLAKEAVDAPDFIEFEESELVVYPHEDDYHLAYRVNLEFHSGDAGNWFIYVDAHTEEVIDSYNAMTGIGHWEEFLDTAPEEGADFGGTLQASGVTPLAVDPGNLRPAGGKGLGTTGVQKNLKLGHGPGEDGGRTFYLSDNTSDEFDGIFTYNMKNTTNQMSLYENDNASWKDVLYEGDSSSWETVGQGPGVDAHKNSRLVYEYFRDNHGRNSLDDEGMAIESRVHYATEFNNAFWSNGLAMMTYGDGDGQQFIPLAALDVTAHEMVHGITHYNGGLRYRFETGAINEAFSDTFASIVDDRSWHVGEDIMGEAWLEDGRFALRSSEDPGLFPVNEAFWAYSIDGEGRYPSHMDEFYFLPGNMDNGGVHINCTILQHSAYLVSEEYGMGREVVADVWYRSYDYLHYDASFAEFREAILQSAIDLYGEDSEEYDAFLGAFDDIGLYEGWDYDENFRDPLW